MAMGAMGPGIASEAAGVCLRRLCGRGVKDRRGACGGRLGRRSGGNGGPVGRGGERAEGDPGQWRWVGSGMVVPTLGRVVKSEGQRWTRSYQRKGVGRIRSEVRGPRPSDGDRAPEGGGGLSHPPGRRSRSAEAQSRAREQFSPGLRGADASRVFCGCGLTPEESRAAG